MAAATSRNLGPSVHRSWEAAMRAGDFERAWQATDQLECIRRKRRWRSEANGELWWDGTPFDGKRVLIRCLHGLGDTLQFMRFVPRIRDVAREVFFAVQPALMPLIGCDPRFGRVINGWVNSWPDHDVEIEVMELPYALRIQVADLTREVPYLRPEVVAQQSSWQPPPERKGLAVGLIWRASGWDERRSLPIPLLSALNIPRVRFYGLQQDAPEEDWRSLPIPVFPLASETRDPLDAAAAMLWLDLIISVDAMPAHLAGALRRPVWVMLKENADWRWMDGRRDSPWYPSMRIFRCRPSWEGVVNEIGDALGKLLGRERS